MERGVRIVLLSTGFCSARFACWVVVYPSLWFTKMGEMHFMVHLQFYMGERTTMEQGGSTTLHY
jgi:hypothetical protein